MKLPTDEELHAAAKARYERDLRTHPNHRPLSRGGLPYGHWLAALMGEREFAGAFNLPMKMELLPSGDGHIDFVLDGLVVDVKTNTWQGPDEYMRVEVKEVAEKTIYVAVNYNFNTNKAVFRGWLFGGEVKRFPVGCLRGQTIRNYNVPVEDLHDISELAIAHAVARQ